ncbi:MAG: ferritin-like domain-containing protein [Candidatus Eisenbacteria bacterium]|nr:ferritin-like domain-containing protein [Candidatus Eisenbacteria bacterium]
MLERSIRDEIHGLLLEPDLERKLAWAEALTAQAQAIGDAAAGPSDPTPLRQISPSRPADFVVLPPHAVPERGTLHTPEGRYRLMHAVCNIEFSAIELALVTAADHPAQPAAFHRDWFRVAGEEVRHARLVMGRLEALGGRFGSEPIHLGLWESAAPYGALEERLAVVPRILEARGLDVSARLRTTLRAAGDPESADLLELIYRDEIGHVGTGSTWFRAACADQGVEPEARFLELYARFRAERGGRPAPLDREGRLRAGFSERELQALAPPPGGKLTLSGE